MLVALPDLSDDAARALALVEIAGRTRDKALQEMEISAESLAELLYVARKALRRSIFPLSASGWCERAERLLSDRIDGVLNPPGPARLDVHLRNCERCVDHERRLSQAREKLVREFIETHPEAAGAGPAERPASASLRVVEPVAIEAPPYDGPTNTVAGFAGVFTEPADAELPMPSFAGPGGQSEIRVDPPSAETEELPGDPPLDDDIPPAEPADTAPSEHDAQDEAPPVDDSEPSVLINPSSLVWGGLSFLSVGLAIFALVITVLAISGIDRF